MKIKKMIKDCTPPIVWNFLSRLKNNSDNKSFYCPVCNKHVTQFLQISDYLDDMLDKYGFFHSVYCIETLNRKAYSCPHCHASDRDRLYAIYIEKRLHTLQKEGKTLFFLDIAPAKNLANWIKKHPCISYRSADLYMEEADDKVDITNMSIYADNSYDFLLCSHVLEHIEDDQKAISELYRILKPDGFAIIMVPIYLNLKEDFENPEYKTEAERWKYFGQNDHVRIYSKKGFMNKLSKVGFKINQFGMEYFGKDVFDRNGIHFRSILYVVEK